VKCLCEINPLSRRKRLETRIVGTAFAAVPIDAPALDRILDDVQLSFVRQLSQPDTETLIAELERIVSAAK
jgi:hypothetical protein